jgi:hypothetical protein
MRTVSALFVDEGGCYANQPDVDVWGIRRDARKYPGPHPVVAHPPCERWCKLAPLVEQVYGYRVGEDAGCFASALDSVRRWGGVLEHPAHSFAWRAFGLTAPPLGGGWVVADDVGGWTCCVRQGRYGHRAQKETWLYACGVELPSMRWGWVGRASAVVSVAGKTWVDGRPRLGKRSAEATPVAFRDVLLAMARTAVRE